MSNEILAIGNRTNNAQLVQDLLQLGYIKETDLIYDPTYGLGRWWTKTPHLKIIATDLNPTKTPSGITVDFQQTPFPNNTFDTTVFDPPYKLNGTSQGYGNDESYGVGNTHYISINDRHQLIKNGITELARITKRTLIVKCQDQVSSGKIQWQTRILTEHAEQTGLTLTDMLYVQGHRKQPPGRTQKHARRDYSTALIFTKHPL